MTQDEIKQIFMTHYREHARMTDSAPESREGRGMLLLQGHEVNRSCGDEITLYLQLEPATSAAGQKAQPAQSPQVDLHFTGRGCSVCIASADILCNELSGRSLPEAREIALELLHRLEDGEHQAAAESEAAAAGAHGLPPGSSHELPGHIPALLSLRDFPIRRKCATMAWKLFLSLEP